MAKSKGIAGKIVAGALALVIAAGGVSLLGYTSRDTDGNWFGGLHWADNKITADGGDVKNENGNTIVNEVESNGMRLMSTVIAEEDYEEYGISALAESATVITATITPAETTNKNVTWSCSDTSGKVTVTPVSGNPLQATVAVSGAFSTQVTITCTSQSNSEVKATCTVDYVKGLERITAPLTISSIKSTAGISSSQFASYTTGTINPTNIEGTIVMEMNDALYNYLKNSKGWSNVKSSSSYSSDGLYGPYSFSSFISSYSTSDKNKIGSSFVKHANCIGINALPSLPFPSLYACIVSNCECEIAKFINSGSIYALFIYSNKFSNKMGTSSGAGGTKIASSIVHPFGPIQFCTFLIFPGSFSLPLTLSSNIL